MLKDKCYMRENRIKRLEVVREEEQVAFWTQWSIALSKNMMLKSRFKGGKGVCFSVIGRKNTPGKRNNECKGSKAWVCLMCSRSRVNKAREEESCRKWGQKWKQKQKQKNNKESLIVHCKKGFYSEHDLMSEEYHLDTMCRTDCKGERSIRGSRIRGQLQYTGER